MSGRLKARWMMCAAILWLATGFLSPRPPVLAAAPMPAHSALAMDSDGLRPALSSIGHIPSTTFSCMEIDAGTRMACPSAVPECCPSVGLAGCCVAVAALDATSPPFVVPYIDKVESAFLSRFIPSSALKEVPLPPPRTVVG